MQITRTREVVLLILSVAMFLLVAHITASGMERFFESHPQLDESPQGLFRNESPTMDVHT